jgi:small subunit ribosomal protein S2
MKPYIFGKRNMIHIIDIKETLKGLLISKKFLAKIVSEGGDVLFVGTKRQARNAVAAHAAECSMHFVCERWLGGTLTNFKTIRSRLARLEELERLDETGEMANYSKKMVSTLQRERKKMKRNLDGIRRMTKMPSAMVIIDPGYEHIAVKEAKKLKIPTICLIDTEGDPDTADIPIPGNDDSMRAVDLIMRELSAAIKEGMNARSEEMPASGQAGDGEIRPLRDRSERPMRRAPQAQPAAPEAPAAPAEAAPVAEVAPVEEPQAEEAN